MDYRKGREPQMQNILDRTVTLVLAGGRGERLAPLTCERSKPAVPFGDRCIIDFVLENCLQSNLNHPFIVTQYQSAHLTRHVGRWWRCHPDFRPNATAAPVCVPAPQTNYAGTASALFRNLRLAPAGTEHVLVLSADHIYDMDYRNLLAAHAASGADVTLGSIVYPSASSHQFGILEVDATDHIVGFQEKPRSPRELPGQPGKVLANMGVYVFRREALGAALAEDAADPLSAHDIGRNILPKLVTHLKVSAFRFEDPETGAPRYWRDVGTIDSYYEASMEWLRRLPASHQLAGSRSVIFPEAHVHPSAEVIDSVLLPGVVVGPKARVRAPSSMKTFR
ncbi:MAG TPA: sugar phosphate nucleotidyltransferase [Terriglobia bacterium]|nr:sugar phosphate nucleotidyltransferase [Terriglobia bacterium]